MQWVSERLPPAGTRIMNAAGLTSGLCLEPLVIPISIEEVEDCDRR